MGPQRDSPSEALEALRYEALLNPLVLSFDSLYHWNMGTTINSQGGPHPPGEIAIPGDGHPDPSLTQPYTILPVGLCLPGCKAPPLSALPSCPDFWQRCRVPRGSLWQPQFLRWEVDSGEGVTSLGAFSLVLVRVFSTWLHGSDSGGTF